MSERRFDQRRLSRLLLRPLTFWRHDVDYSIAAALSMARREAQLGVRATYYVMTDSPFYSAATAYTFATVVTGLGHEIGWHVDGRLASPRSIAAAAPGSDISFHCPRDSELWTRFPGFRSAYDPIWKDRYYSDSRGRFSHGDPEDHPGNETIQINLHPEWWFEPDWHEQVGDETYEAFFHETKWGVAR